MKKRVVVVGLGNYSLTMHIPALKASKKAELIGVMSSDPNDIDLYAKQFNVPGFTDLSTCLDNLRPDFVILAVYHNQYLPLVKEAAKRGVHILYEKPFGFDLAESKKIVNIVAKSKLHMQIGVQRRFAPDFIAFAKQVSAMQDKYFFEVNYSVAFQYPHSGWRGKKAIAGGGSIMDFGYHVIDVLLWNFGLPNGIITEISWKAKPDKIYDTEDTATFLLRYKPREFYGNIILSRILPRKEYYKVIGSQEMVEYDNGVVRVSTIQGKVLKEKSFKVSKVETVKKEIDYFCDVIDNKVKPISTPVDHLAHMAMVTAAYNSEIQGKYIDPHRYL
jgi:predicted dehydrogenase